MSSENTTPLLRNEKRHKHTHTHKDQVERTHLVVDGTLLLRARKKRDANTRLTVKLPNISLGISHLLSVENGERTRKREKKENLPSQVQTYTNGGGKRAKADKHHG